ncbi:MAG: ABC transporter substrate-binding protein [Blautia sp.]|nr:ABC transporter substrate-binding protein [Blautia sp.]
MKKVFALLLAGTMVLSMGSAALAEEAGTKQSLSIAISSDFGTMAPGYMSGVAGYTVYETLFLADGTGVLADSWEFPDDTHMLVHLKEGIHDSEGNPFTADDVLYSLDLMHNDFISAMYIPFIDFENSEIIDDLTVSIATTEPNVDAWKLMYDIKMTTREAYEASGDGMASLAVGTGKYKMVEYIPSSTIKLVRNENYWGEVPAAYDNLTFYIITESSQRAIAVESGQCNVAVEISASDFNRLNEEGTFNTAKVGGFTQYNLYYNCSEYSLCSNEHLRRAISYAVDGDTINTVVFKGLYGHAYGTGAVNCSGQDLSWIEDYYETDLDKAKAELEEAGIPAGTKLVLGCPANDINLQMAQVVQGMVSQIGLEVEIQSFETATYDEVLTQPDSGLDFSVRQNGCPDGYYGNQINVRINSSNQIHYENAERNDLLAKSLRTLDEEKQLEINKQIAMIIYEACPYYNYMEMNILYCYDNSIEGWDEMVESARGGTIHYECLR